MKKLTRKEINDMELNFLTETGLTDEELAVIRKLNGATRIKGASHSPRTIEAVLQGRRSNPPLLQRAIHNAIEQLEYYKIMMDNLLKKLRK